MQTDPIKQRIQELVPGIKYEDARWNGFEETRFTVEKPITLAVVLRAIRTTWKNSEPVQEQMIKASQQYVLLDKWNLAADYDDQKQETKDFIGSLLLGK